MLSKRGRRGFTLFELLVVMAIILIVAGISMMGFKGWGSGRALETSRSQVHAMLRVARGQAALYGRDTRLIVNLDQNDPEKFLRYFGIVVRGESDPATWQAIHKGMYLPEGVYFVPLDGLSKVSYVNWTVGVYPYADSKSGYYRTNDTTDGLATMTIDYPELSPVDESGGTTWAAYGFLPSGKLSDVSNGGIMAGTNVQSSHIVLAKGDLELDGSVVFTDSNEVTGIRIRQNGNTYVVDDPSGL